MWVEWGLSPEEPEVLTDMSKWTRVRVRMEHEEISKRELCRQEKIAYKTLQKILTHPSPPGYRSSKPRRKRKIDAHLDWIFQVLLDDESILKKQRHTAPRLWDRRAWQDGETESRRDLETIEKADVRWREILAAAPGAPGEWCVGRGCEPGC